MLPDIRPEALRHDAFGIVVSVILNLGVQEGVGVCVYLCDKFKSLGACDGMWLGFLGMRLRNGKPFEPLEDVFEGKHDEW